MVRSEEHIQIIAVCDFWEGHGVLRNQTPYYEEVTQLFYANLVFHEDGMSATFIHVWSKYQTLESLASWFGLANEGEQIDFTRIWPRGETEDIFEYRRWFDPTWVRGIPQ